MQLNSLDASRGIAALLVVIYHVTIHFEHNFGALPFGDWTSIGHVGVDFFFVLSGFVILHAHSQDIGHPNKIRSYLSKRVIRVYPIYLTLLAFMLLTTPFSNREMLPVDEIILNGLLSPFGSYRLIIGVAWSLKNEILFYLIFILFLLNRALGLIIISAWLAFIVFDKFISPINNLSPILSSAFNLQFMMGMLAYKIIDSKKIRSGATAFCLGAILLLASMLSELQGAFEPFGPHARILYGLSSMLIVIGLVTLEMEHKFKINSFLMLLGKSSYTLYLFHGLISGLIYKVLVKIDLIDKNNQALTAIGIIVVTTILSCLLSKYYELPLTKWLRTNTTYKTSQSSLT